MSNHYRTNCLDWVEELMVANPGNVRKPQNYLRHIELTADIAKETSEKIIVRYPCAAIRIFPTELYVAGLVHDIGVPVAGDLFHELHGAQLIEEEGSRIGLPVSESRYRVAQMIRSHFVVAEQFSDQANYVAGKPFRDLDKQLLYPRTWQEMILTYADLSNTKGERVDVHDRMVALVEKSNTPEELGTNPSRGPAMKEGMDRLLKIYDTVLRAETGLLKDNEFTRYGFL